MSVCVCVDVCGCLSVCVCVLCVVCGWMGVWVGSWVDVWCTCAWVGAAYAYEFHKRC